MNDAQVMELVRTKLKKLFRIQKLILFGSHAKGTATDSSDYDVLVVADSDVPFVQRQGEALLALGRRPFPIDLLVYTPKELERAASIPGSAVYWALREGREYA